MSDRVLKIMQEFAGADLGDERLERRLVDLASAMAEEPSESFPRALTPAGLEAAYRLFRNGRVSLERVVEPHRKQTAARASQLAEVVIAHDTSEFRFGGKSRRNLGTLGTAGHGFLAHVSLAIAPGTRDPLGVAHVETWTRDDQSVSKKRRRGELSHSEARRSPERESVRWQRGVDEVEALVGATTSVLHVMDSEADDYVLLTMLSRAHRRFVVRLGHNRTVVDEEMERSLRELAMEASVVAEREVQLSPRKRPVGGKDKRRQERTGRKAELAVSGMTVTLRRPAKYAETDGPKTLPMNVVCVREVDPPQGEDGVEWLLMTNEPIGNAEELLRLVDAYRGRWVIEEYFKALKTGCAVEARQLESLETLLIAFGLFIPIAWVLLRLRTLSRCAEPAGAGTVLTRTQIAVLVQHHRSRLKPDQPTVRDALMAVARLGGHLRSNGDPGWIVLCRGFSTLLQLEEGYLLARAEEM